MALLHFKPAPMYILDEIVSRHSVELPVVAWFVNLCPSCFNQDAALDLSHSKQCKLSLICCQLC